MDINILSFHSHRIPLLPLCLSRFPSYTLPLSLSPFLPPSPTPLPPSSLSLRFNQTTTYTVLSEEIEFHLDSPVIVVRVWDVTDVSDRSVSTTTKCHSV